MLVTITSTSALGLLIQAVRKTQKLRMDDVAGSAGVGHVFVREVERGKETAQIGRVMSLLDELGIVLKVDVPESAIPMYESLQASGSKPLIPRRDASATKRQPDAGPALPSENGE